VLVAKSGDALRERVGAALKSSARAGGLPKDATTDAFLTRQTSDAVLPLTPLRFAGFPSPERGEGKLGKETSVPAEKSLDALGERIGAALGSSAKARAAS
jgi:hypothetical protein